MGVSILWAFLSYYSADSFHSRHCALLRMRYVSVDVNKPVGYTYLTPLVIRNAVSLTHSKETHALRSGYMRPALHVMIVIGGATSLDQMTTFYKTHVTLDRACVRDSRSLDEDIVLFMPEPMMGEGARDEQIYMYFHMGYSCNFIIFLEALHEVTMSLSSLKRTLKDCRNTTHVFSLEKLTAFHITNGVNYSQPTYSR